MTSSRSRPAGRGCCRTWTSSEVARLARAMTWKFAAWRVPYAGAKAGVRFAGGARDESSPPTGGRSSPTATCSSPGRTWAPSRPTSPHALEGPPPLWAQSHEGVDMDDLATGHGVKAAAEAALAHRGRALSGAADRHRGLRQGRRRDGARVRPRGRPHRRREHGRRAARRPGRARRRRAVRACASASATRSWPTGGRRSARARSCSTWSATCSSPARGRTRSRATWPRACAARSSRRARTSPTVRAPWRSCTAAASSPCPTSSPTPAASTSTRRVDEDASAAGGAGVNRGAHPRGVARTLAAADEHGITPLAAAFRAGREFLAESGARGRAAGRDLRLKRRSRT